MGFNSFEFADEVANNLVGNLSTLSVGNLDLNIWTNNTAALTKDWQTGGNPDIENYIKNDINSWQQFEDFCNKYLSGNGDSGDKYLYELSSQDMTLLLGRLADKSVWDDKQGPTYMSMVQQYSNLISATQQQETSTGDTETKAEASYLQQSTSAQQTISDMGTSAIGVFGSVASVLMQSFL